jgi:hypothetical protein
MSYLTHAVAVYITHPSLLIEGRLLETILKAEQGVAFRGCGS